MFVQHKSLKWVDFAKIHRLNNFSKDERILLLNSHKFIQRIQRFIIILSEHLGIVIYAIKRNLFETIMKLEDKIIARRNHDVKLNLFRSKIIITDYFFGAYFMKNVIFK